MNTTRHKAQKVAPGHYIYRGHNINHEQDYSGPEGGARVHWSISGAIGGPDEDRAHPELPCLNTLRAAKAWLDAYLDHGRAAAQAVENANAPTIWGA